MHAEDENRSRRLARPSAPGSVHALVRNAGERQSAPTCTASLRDPCKRSRPKGKVARKPAVRRSRTKGSHAQDFDLEQALKNPQRVEGIQARDGEHVGHRGRAVY